jgi:hypothetical protein
VILVVEREKQGQSGLHIRSCLKNTEKEKERKE